MKRRCKQVATGLLMVALLSGFSLQGVSQRYATNYPIYPGWGADSVWLQNQVTPDQWAKIDQIRLAHFQENQQLWAQLNEKEAYLNSLWLAEVPDEKAIDKTISEVGDLRTKAMKMTARHRKEMGKVLTPQQRRMFQSRPGGGYGLGYGQGLGYGNGMGRGLGYGRGMGRGGGLGYGAGYGRGMGYGAGYGAGYGRGGGRNVGRGLGRGYGRGLNPYCPYRW